MIARSEKNQIYGEAEALLDEVAEAARKQEMNPRKIQSIVNLVREKQREALRAIDEGHEVREVVKAYRLCIHKVLKKI